MPRGLSRLVSVKLFAVIKKTIDDFEDLRVCLFCPFETTTVECPALTGLIGVALCVCIYGHIDSLAAVTDNAVKSGSYHVPNH